MQNESTLLRAVRRFKPAGKNKHWNMLSIKSFMDSNSNFASIGECWQLLEKLYDLQAADELEFKAEPETMHEFELSDDEYGDLMLEHAQATTESESDEPEEEDADDNEDHEDTDGREGDLNEQGDPEPDDPEDQEAEEEEDRKEVPRRRTRGRPTPQPEAEEEPPRRLRARAPPAKKTTKTAKKASPKPSPKASPRASPKAATKLEKKTAVKRSRQSKKPEPPAKRRKR